VCWHPGAKRGVDVIATRLALVAFDLPDDVFGSSPEQTIRSNLFGRNRLPGIESCKEFLLGGVLRGFTPMDQQPIDVARKDFLLDPATVRSDPREASKNPIRRTRLGRARRAIDFETALRLRQRLNRATQPKVPETCRTLDRRIRDVGRVPKALDRLRATADRLPDPSRLLRRRQR